jgi:hypothetical protein
MISLSFILSFYVTCHNVLELSANILIEEFLCTMHTIVLHILFIACSMGFLTPRVGWTEDVLASLTVLALAPLEAQAVIRWPDGHLRLVRQGEQIEGTNTILLQILPDRLVLTERSVSLGQAPLQRLVWLYKAPPDGGPSRVLRFYRDPPVQEFAVDHSLRLAPVSPP